MKNPDYNHLYFELGLEPGCGIDELRQAYRRHVAGLHPDRGDPGRQHGGDGSLPLSDLNALYGEAIRFQQRYGRLPGAPQPIHARASTSAPPASGDVDAGQGDALSDPGRRLWLGLLLVAVVVAALVLGSPDTVAPTAQENADAAPEAGASSTEPLPTRLELGMDAATVLAIQGEPVGKSDVEWTYGPSWLRFEKGKLADWYSSQLYPLRTGSTRPPPAEALTGPAP
jgi:hypothetical protein